MYVFMHSYKILSNIIIKYSLLSRALSPIKVRNIYFSVYPPPDILSGLSVDCQVNGDLKVNRPSSGFLAENPSTHCIIVLRRSSLIFVNSSLPPEPSLAEVHCAAL